MEGQKRDLKGKDTRRENGPENQETKEGRRDEI